MNAFHKILNEWCWQADSQQCCISVNFSISWEYSEFSNHLEISLFELLSTFHLSKMAECYFVHRGHHLFIMSGSLDILVAFVYINHDHDKLVFHQPPGRAFNNLLQLSTYPVLLTLNISWRVSWLFCQTKYRVSDHRLQD